MNKQTRINGEEKNYKQVQRPGSRRVPHTFKKPPDANVAGAEGSRNEGFIRDGIWEGRQMGMGGPGG